jgi:hypothetical protein
MKRNLMLAAGFAVPFLAACSGGNNNGDTPAVMVNPVCPSAASLTYSTTWIGGSGSGELVKVQLDTTKLTWQVTFVESEVPATTGTPAPSRAGTSLSGTMTQETLLPTQQLNQCTYRLNGASLDPSTPARVFIGNGVIGGMLPGKEVEYAGLSSFGVLIGAIPDASFRFFPFLAFSSLDTSLARVAANSPYTQLGFSIQMTSSATPPNNFATNPIDAKLTFNSDGSYAKCDTTGYYSPSAGGPQCRSSAPSSSFPSQNYFSSYSDPVGENFVQSPDGTGAFESDYYEGQQLNYFTTQPSGKGFLLLGKVPGGDLPVLIRTGAVNPSVGVVDDEVGISLLAPQTNIAQGSVDGTYVMVDSTIPATSQYPGGNNNQFDYRSLLISGTEATLTDPFNISNTATTLAETISYSQQTPPGSVTMNLRGASATNLHSMIFGSGGVAYLDQTNPQAPYFMAGFFAQLP